MGTITFIKLFPEKLFIGSFLCLLSLIAQCEAPKKLSLREAVMLALRFNTAIRNAELDRISQKWALRLAKNFYEPQYSLSGSASLYQSSRSNGKLTNTSPDFGLTPGVSWNSPIGSKIGINAPQVRDGRSYGAGISVEITQPLLKGFGTEIGLASLRAAYDSEEVNKLKLRDSIGAAIITVVQNYRALIIANNQVQTSLKSLEDAKKNIKINEAKIKAGQLPPTANIQAEAQLESLKLDIERQLNAAEQAKQTLLSTIGIDLETNIVVPDNVEIMELKIPELEQAIELALANNGNYQSQVIGMRGVKRALLIAKDNARWDLGLKFSGSVGSAELRKGIKSITNGQNYSKNLSLSLNIPVNDLKRKKDIIDAEIGLKKAEISLQESERDLIKEIKNAIVNIKSLLQQIHIGKRSVELEQRSYELEIKKQRLGRTSALDVSNAQGRLITAKNNLISNKISYLNAMDSLNQKLGITLKEWNIELTY